MGSQGTKIASSENGMVRLSNPGRCQKWLGCCGIGREHGESDGDQDTGRALDLQEVIWSEPVG